MISVVLPYWKRAEVTQRSLALFDKHYAGNPDFEVVIVDDGSHDIYWAEPAPYPWLHVLRLPKKETPKNPCVPINEGVKIAKGDVIVLSNPEIMHHQPVLGAMLETLRELGPNGYVLAACWYDKEKEWHCHSSLTSDGYHRGSSLHQPKGSGFHFCAMLNRSLWEKAGGFDEEYRDGSHYDDPDWVNRVARAGAVFKIRDDLIVEHIREGAETNWPGGAADRNRALYISKWGHA